MSSSSSVSIIIPYSEDDQLVSDCISKCHGHLAAEPSSGSVVFSPPWEQQQQPQVQTALGLQRERASLDGPRRLRRAAAAAAAVERRQLRWERRMRLPEPVQQRGTVLQLRPPVEPPLVPTLLTKQVQHKAQRTLGPGKSASASDRASQQQQKQAQLQQQREKRRQRLKTAIVANQLQPRTVALQQKPPKEQRAAVVVEQSTDNVDCQTDSRSAMIDCRTVGCLPNRSERRSAAYPGRRKPSSKSTGQKPDAQRKGGPQHRELGGMKDEVLRAPTVRSKTTKLQRPLEALLPQPSHRHPAPDQQRFSKPRASNSGDASDRTVQTRPRNRPTDAQSAASRLMLPPYQPLPAPPATMHYNEQEAQLREVEEDQQSYYVGDRLESNEDAESDQSISYREDRQTATSAKTERSKTRELSRTEPNRAHKSQRKVKTHGVANYSYKEINDQLHQLVDFSPDLDLDWLQQPKINYPTTVPRLPPRTLTVTVPGPSEQESQELEPAVSQPSDLNSSHRKLQQGSNKTYQLSGHRRQCDVNTALTQQHQDRPCAQSTRQRLAGGRSDLSDGPELHAATDKQPPASRPPPPPPLPPPMSPPPRRLQVVLADCQQLANPIATRVVILDRWRTPSNSAQSFPTG